MRSALLFLFLILVGCKDEKKATAPPLEAAATAVASATASSTQGAVEPTVTVAPLPLGDGGACTVDVGPIAMDFTGAPAITATEKGALVAGNDKGTPHVVKIEGGKGVSLTAGALKTSSLPCAFAKGQAFCADADGKIAGVGKARSGTRMGAAEIGGHALVAFIEEKKTTEGMTQMATLWSDDGTTQRLSDEGNGATFVDLAARDGEVIALMIDAHMGMTPIHARSIKWSGNKPSLGSDTVMMIAGNAEANTGGAIATKHDTGPSFALVPIAQDISAFGVVSIRIEGVPKVDAKTEWSLYDNGLDPAPIAATHDASSRMLVARVRPTGKAASALRVLELGKLEADGKFVSFGVVPSHGNVSSVAMSADAKGVWLAYSDGAGTFVDHRICP